MRKSIEKRARTWKRRDNRCKIALRKAHSCSMCGSKNNLHVARSYHAAAGKKYAVCCEIMHIDSDGDADFGCCSYGPGARTPRGAVRKWNRGVLIRKIFGRNPSKLSIQA